MKKLGVCGDSYMASMSYDETNLDNGYDKHFTELLVKKLNWNIVTFARVGCSNQTIRLQIDEIIKEKPDLVIIGTTMPDRLEFPINDIDLYDIENGIYNIDYRDCPNVSCNNIKFNEIKPKLISMTLNDIFTGYKLRFTKDEIEMLKFWYQRFFDNKWKQQQDSWIIANGLRKLLDNNIPFFCINSFLLYNEFEIFGDRIVYDSELNPWSYWDNENKYWFHTTLESQVILANKWYNFLNKHNIIKFI
jgi:hypothetical protein